MTTIHKTSPNKASWKKSFHNLKQLFNGALYNQNTGQQKFINFSNLINILNVRNTHVFTMDLFTTPQILG